MALPKGLKPLPEILAHKANAALDSFKSAASAANLDIADIDDDKLIVLFAASDYACRISCQFPELIAQSFKMIASPVDQKISKFIELSDADIDMAIVQKKIRQFRHLILIRILWRFALGLSELAIHLKELSALADCCIQVSHDWLFNHLAKDYGYPMLAGQKQPLIIVGMGKLGGYELNFSSDIDLIYCFPNQGQTQHGPKSIAHEKFYQMLAQKLHECLATQTADGFAYRIDLRLRPHGGAGAIVLSFNALENYYQTHGRDWERYAWIKARAITGDPRQINELFKLLDPFVYRRYLDFSAFGSLRDMKQKVQAQSKKSNFKANLKLGQGGIRQIEFIAQMFQLIRAGKEPQFKTQSLALALERLANASHLSEQTYVRLTAAYHFLRSSEHWLQIHNDEQTHDISNQPLVQARISWGMGFEHYQNYMDALDKHRNEVQTQFDTISTPLAKASSQPSDESHLFASLWAEEQEDEPKARLSQDPETVQQIEAQLKRFKQSKPVTAMPSTARQRLDTFMPMLLNEVCLYDNASELLTAILRVIRNITRRSSYLLLLIENPKALHRFVMICSKSPWIVKQMADFPVLIDELLSPLPTSTSFDKAQMAKQLEDSMKWVESDLDGQMEKLRWFKLSVTLKLAIMEVSAQKPMHAGQVLTTLAEVILEKTYQISCEQIQSKYSFDQSPKPLGVIAYGNFGAKELHYHSDLDLVFIYEQENLDGLQKEALQDFYLRLAQRTIHILSTQTLSGKLYEIDVRLRPGGRSGMLVTSLEAYAKYVEQDAWTYEHQALVRARLLLGHATLNQQFDLIRANVLTQKRPDSNLRQEIALMREKMRKSLNPMKGFHLKQSRGGMTDIEFIVQYYVLLYARKFPILLSLTDTQGLLSALKELKLLDGPSFDDLMSATVFYQSHIRLRILQQSEQRAAQEVQPWAFRVASLWQELMQL